MGAFGEKWEDINWNKEESCLRDVMIYNYKWDYKWVDELIYNIGKRGTTGGDF